MKLKWFLIFHITGVPCLLETPSLGVAIEYYMIINGIKKTRDKFLVNMFNIKHYRRIKNSIVLVETYFSIEKTLFRFYRDFQVELLNKEHKKACWEIDLFDMIEIVKNFKKEIERRVKSIFLFVQSLEKQM